MTVIMTSLLLESVPSEAVKRSTWGPAAEKVAVVPGALTLAKMTVPGPLILDQLVVKVLPAGKPSSEAVPLKLAVAGSAML